MPRSRRTPGRPTSTGPGFCRLAAVSALVLGTLLTGCTYSDREPGLFGTPRPTPSTPPPPASAPTAWSTSGTDRLPVLGERTWTTGDGSRLTVRIAVHALRRFDGGTALDWSVTPLPTHEAVGQPLPTTVNLGLTRFSEGNLNIALIDPVHGRVYRPLTATDPDQLQHCLCTPIWIAERNLRFGVTTLLQAAFPPLPTDVSALDVDITTVPMFSAIPVTGIGRVPLPQAGVDLAAPAPEQPVQAWSKTFRYPAPPGQKLRLGVVQVLAGPSSTSVEWVIQTATAGDEVLGITLPPLIAPDAGSRYGYAGGYTSGAAVVGVDGVRRNRWEARSMTAELSGLDQSECLCTDIRLWSGGLIRSGARISVVTNLPALPRSARSVDIGFPGLPVLRDLALTRTAVTEGPPATTAGEPRTWTYTSFDPPAGWPASQWPTPLPNPRQLSGYTATVDTLH